MTYLHEWLLGKPKSTIMTYFAKEDCVEFLHWLYVPTLGMVLSFDRQLCSHVGQI